MISYNTAKSFTTKANGSSDGIPGNASIPETAKIHKDMLKKTDSNLLKLSNELGVRKKKKLENIGQPQQQNYPVTRGTDARLTGFRLGLESHCVRSVGNPPFEHEKASATVIFFPQAQFMGLREGCLLYRKANAS